jgi:hypothetical protein
MSKHILWSNPLLPLMPAPNSEYKPLPKSQTCQYCGGREEGEELPPPSRINGKRIPQAHKACLEAAAHPLFDMSEKSLHKRE